MRVIKRKTVIPTEEEKISSRLVEIEKRIGEYEKRKAEQLRRKKESKENWKKRNREKRDGKNICCCE